MRLKEPLAVALLAVLAGVAAWLLAGRETPVPVSPTETPRIVCLMPPITATLIELGAEDLLVGRSDYDDEPQVALLPACGSTLQPNVEAIARTRPSLIVGEASVGAARDKLEALAPSTFLPWLTAGDVVESTRKLGALSGHSAEADALADDLQRALVSRAGPNSPRMLLAMSHEPGHLSAVYFMRPNSLHGAMLEAAGFRNAVEQEISGVPQLSIEAVLELDPDVIVVLDSSPELPAARRAALLADWQALKPLRAVEGGRVLVLNGKHLFPAGRGIIAMIGLLKAKVPGATRHD